jgi:pimeloyl-ACP methyl ester carboxylesterase
MHSERPAKREARHTHSLALALCAGFLLLSIVSAGCGTATTTTLAPTTTTVQQMSAEAAQIAAVPFQMVTVGDIQTEYKIIGQGEPLLMIMGFSGTAETWDPRLIVALAKEYRVIVFDNRGCGHTTLGTAPYVVEQLGDDAAGLVQALGLGTTHLLGFSMGTNIAQEAYLRHPELFDRVVLYAGDPGGKEAIDPTDEVIAILNDASGTPQERGMRFLSIMVSKEWMAKNPEFYRQLQPATEMVDPSVVALQSRAMQGWGGSMSRLGQVKAPFMLLTGAEDILVPPQNSLLMVPVIPSCWLVQFPGAGHGLLYQYPAQMAAAIISFLKNSVLVQ